MRVNRQHACCSHKNVILREKINPRSWRPRFNVVLPVIVDRHAATLPGPRRRPRTVPRTWWSLGRRHGECGPIRSRRVHSWWPRQHRLVAGDVFCWLCWPGVGQLNAPIEVLQQETIRGLGVIHVHVNCTTTLMVHIISSYFIQKTTYKCVYRIKCRIEFAQQ